MHFNCYQVKLKSRYKQETWISLINELMLEFGALENRKVTEKKFQSEVEGMERWLLCFYRL